MDFECRTLSDDEDDDFSFNVDSIQSKDPIPVSKSQAETQYNANEDSWDDLSDDLIPKSRKRKGDEAVQESKQQRAHRLSEVMESILSSSSSPLQVGSPSPEPLPPSPQTESPSPPLDAVMPIQSPSPPQRESPPPRLSSPPQPSPPQSPSPPIHSSPPDVPPSPEDSLLVEPVPNTHSTEVTEFGQILLFDQMLDSSHISTYRSECQLIGHNQRLSLQSLYEETPDIRGGASLEAENLFVSGLLVVPRKRTKTTENCGDNCLILVCLEGEPSLLRVTINGHSHQINPSDVLWVPKGNE